MPKPTLEAEQQYSMTLEEAQDNDLVEHHNIRPLSEVKMTKPNWLSTPWIRGGAINLLGGKPKAGKSTIAMVLIRKVLRNRPEGKVLYFSREDDFGEVVRPRATVHGVDANRILVSDGHATYNTLHEYDGFVKRNNIVLCVFDTIQRYAPPGKLNWYNAFDVAEGLTGLESLIVNTGVAALLIGHTKKGKSDSAMDAFLGSTGIPGMARVGLYLHDMKNDNNERALAMAFNNYAQDAFTEIYTYESDSVKSDDGDYFPTVKAEFVREAPELEADDLVSMESAELSKAPARQAAEEFVLNYLGTTPVPATVVRDAALRAGINQRTLEQAIKNLKLQHRIVSEGATKNTQYRKV